MKTRRCNTCKTEKPLDEFYRSRNNRLGRDYQCKMCRKKYAKENPEIVNRAANRYYHRKSEWINRKARARYHEKKAV